ncbi:MAG: hypothetical protein HETSPECPRED_002994 [Heterodermia speciosa]|uniref:Uncharacterized protein n=1 Tax=Heterodermia speciosa TaxID=116794 RepID=A0A8H3I6I5_9LECA|nr:MAG: hypothetical protein HETSPECPRED_002994 [Heterodermia speciosa]
MTVHNATHPHCDVPYNDYDSVWKFCPSVPAAWVFTILFAITLVAHIAQGIIHRKGYSWVVAMSALWQTGAYLFRVISIKNPTSDGPYMIYFILLLVAPLWINAYIYMVFGRMIFNFTSDARLAKIKAWRFGLYFVLLDIFAFLIQLYGAASASKPNLSDDKILRGIHIYMGGIGIQQFFVLVFTFLVAKFHLLLLRQSPSARKSRAVILLAVVYAVILAITVRIIFRLVEYAKGFKTTIPLHEAYQYALDSLPMLLALLLLNAFHPGRLMPGPESDFPPRSQRKHWRGPNAKGDESFLPGAASGGTYVPMGGFSGRNSPDHGDSYTASHSQAGFGAGAPRPVAAAYPQGTPYGQGQGWGAGEAEGDRMGRNYQRPNYGGFAG